MSRSCDVGHLDGVERSTGGGLGIGQPVQLRVGQHELPAGDDVVHRLALGHEPDAAGRSARCATPARRRGSRVPDDGARKPRHHVDQRRLAGAVGAEQAGDAGADRHRHVVDGDDVAVPARDRRRASASLMTTGHLPVAQQQQAVAAGDQRERRRARTRCRRSCPAGGLAIEVVGAEQPTICTPSTRVNGEISPA